MSRDPKVILTEKLVAKTRADVQSLEGQRVIEMNGAFYEIKKLRLDKGEVTLRALRRYQIERLLNQNPQMVEAFAQRLAAEEREKGGGRIIVPGVGGGS